MKLKSILLATALSVAISAPVYAAHQRWSEIPLIPTETPAKLDADVKYATGGIGEDERAELEASKPQYNVHITNARKTGEFLEDTRTVISRKNGKEFEPLLDVNAGPLLYVELAPGSYQAEATRYGETKKKAFVIKAKSTKSTDFGFYWPAPVADELR